VQRKKQTIEGESNTTGEAGFPECQMHSGKAPKHSGKTYRGCFSRGSALPECQFSHALGEPFPECQPSSRGRFNAVDTVSRFFTLPRVQHSGKNFLFWNFFPKCNTRARIFKKILFPECLVPSTRGRKSLFFINVFPECRCLCTRGSPLLLFFFSFFCFYIWKTKHIFMQTTNRLQHITNHIYKWQMTKYV
jgi:hypothetical protein